MVLELPEVELKYLDHNAAPVVALSRNIQPLEVPIKVV